MEITRNEADLLHFIAEVALLNGGECELTDKELLGSMGVSERTYYRTLLSLENKDIITRHTQSVGFYGKKRKIILNIPEEYYTKYSTK
jgi:CTP-dependent riboflavin kinase